MNALGVRALSERQARACENATTSKCRCRCNGRFHGAARGDVRELPVDDVHRPAPAEARVRVPRRPWSGVVR